MNSVFYFINHNQRIKFSQNQDRFISWNRSSDGSIEFKCSDIRTLISDICDISYANTIAASDAAIFAMLQTACGRHNIEDKQYFDRYGKFVPFIFRLNIDRELTMRMIDVYLGISKKRDSDIRFVSDKINFDLDVLNPDIDLLERMVNLHGPRNFRVFKSDPAGIDRLLNEFKCELVQENAIKHLELMLAKTGPQPAFDCVDVG